MVDLARPGGAIAHLQPETTAIEVRNLNVRYGTYPVLTDIYAHFRKNAVTAIMGPSGCGKSTFINAMNRTLELDPSAHITSGELFYEGADIYAPGQSAMAIRKEIGIIYQRPITFPMSIINNVLFGPNFHGQFDGLPKRDYAINYLEKVGLAEELHGRLDQPAHKLSGGQQQRLCLARTLANQPSVILMDEPCASLDPVATRRIEQLITAMKADYTIIVVTHNMAQARRISGEAIFMLDGRVVEAGETRQLFENPKTGLMDEFAQGQMG